MRARTSPHSTNTESAPVMGVATVFTAVLVGVVACLAVAKSTTWSLAIVIPIGVLIGALVGMISRAVISGPARGARNLGGRAAIAVAIGIVVGELAAVVVFSSSVQRVLDGQIAQQADGAPAVVQASKQLDQDRQTRAALTDAVDQARRHRDDALVVARCEYNPRPECPQTQITGDPGEGPETQTANDFLAGAQRELDDASAERDTRVPGLDTQIATDEQAVAQARANAIAQADTGLGARWVAMNHYTASSLSALALRVLTVAFFVLLIALPLILKVWRGETAQDRRAAADAARERAELDADTAVAVKRAEVRAASETLWVERELESARLAVAAETEIERAQQRQRVFDAVGGPAPERIVGERVGAVTAKDDGFLPIEAEAAAASRAAALPAAAADMVTAQGLQNLPAPVNLPAKSDQGGWSSIPVIPEVAEAAARWVRPFVPPIVANAIDATTHPFRTARQVIEEVEEIGLTFKRTRRIAVEESAPAYYPGAAFPPEQPIPGQSAPAQGWVEAAPAGWYGAAVPQPPLAPADYPPELAPREGAPELPRHEGPWQLPPAY